MEDPVLTLGILSESIADPMEALGAVGRITFSAPKSKYKVYHIEMDETKWLWRVERSIILMTYGT